MIAKFTTTTGAGTKTLGEQIGRNLTGGEVFELLSDLGGGKTTFVSGLAAGFGSPDPVASPSFTVSYTYSRPDKKQFHHFDFYRLDEAGIVGSELGEFLEDSTAVIAVEWGEVVRQILPPDRVVVRIEAPSENTRTFTVTYPTSRQYLFKGVQV